MRNPGCTRRLLACRPGWLGPSAGVSGGYQPGFAGEHDGLDPVAQAELGQDPADMNLHCALGQEQAGRDLAVRPDRSPGLMADAGSSRVRVSGVDFSVGV